MLHCVGSQNKIVPGTMSHMMATVLDNHHFGTGQCPCLAAYFQACIEWVKFIINKSDD